MRVARACPHNLPSCLPSATTTPVPCRAGLLSHVTPVVSVFIDTVLPFPLSFPGDKGGSVQLPRQEVQHAPEQRRDVLRASRVSKM